MYIDERLVDRNICFVYKNNDTHYFPILLFIARPTRSYYIYTHPQPP